MIAKIEPQWVKELFTNADKHGIFVRRLLRDSARDPDFETVWLPRDPGEKALDLTAVREKAKRLN